MLVLTRDTGPGMDAQYTFTARDTIHGSTQTIQPPLYLRTMTVISVASRDIKVDQS